VALPVPSDREKTQVYIQRYITHFPAAGEIILFDRSWYNRAGVERLMGFCTDEEYERFLAVTPVVEREIAVNMGIILRKYFLDVSQDEQRRRFEARIKDPVKHWKLSPMDTESVQRGKDPVPNSKRVGRGIVPDVASELLWLKLISWPGTPLVLVNRFDCVSANAV
jgi:polyphosphate kinase